MMVVMMIGSLSNQRFIEQTYERAKVVYFAMEMSISLLIRCQFNQHFMCNLYTNVFLTKKYGQLVHLKT
jgi:hypothetical protein